MKGSGATSLAIVRCGDDSLHGQWSGSGRQFDVAVSYFGDDPDKSFPEADFVHRCKGGKWEGIYNFFQSFPDTLNDYDYFWFPDDDLLASHDDINALMELGQSRNLDVFQPSLDEESYYSHLITLQHPYFTIRYTNFVETMTPVISKRVLDRILPYFKEVRFGFGFDYLFPQFAIEAGADSAQCCAIIDFVTIRHTRPVGGALHQAFRGAEGRTAREEMAEVINHVSGRKDDRLFGIPIPSRRILSAIGRNEERYFGLKLSFLTAWSMRFNRANTLQPPGFLRSMKHVYKTMAF